VRREESRIPNRLEAILRRIGQRIPFCILSSKDLRFLAERVPFATAIAAINGLECKIGGDILRTRGPTKNPSLLEDLLNSWEKRLASICEEMVIERKSLSSGELVAFSIDWRLCKDLKELRAQLDPAIAAFRTAGLRVSSFSSLPWVDVYLEQMDKGYGFSLLRRRLKIVGPVLYLGDTEADNPAFRLSEISVGVVQGQVRPLECKFSVEYSDLPAFLEGLIERDLVFHEDMPWLRKADIRP